MDPFLVIALVASVGVGFRLWRRRRTAELAKVAQNIERLLIPSAPALQPVPQELWRAVDQTRFASFTASLEQVGFRVFGDFTQKKLFRDVRDVSSVLRVFASADGAVAAAVVQIVPTTDAARARGVGMRPLVELETELDDGSWVVSILGGDAPQFDGAQITYLARSGEPTDIPDLVEAHRARFGSSSPVPIATFEDVEASQLRLHDAQVRSRRERLGHFSAKDVKHYLGDIDGGSAASIARVIRRRFPTVTTDDP